MRLPVEVSGVGAHECVSINWRVNWRFTGAACLAASFQPTRIRDNARRLTCKPFRISCKRSARFDPLFFNIDLAGFIVCGLYYSKTTQGLFTRADHREKPTPTKNF